jgi:hypothetical protein
VYFYLPIAKSSGIVEFVISATKYLKKIFHLKVRKFGCRGHQAKINES